MQSVLQENPNIGAPVVNADPEVTAASGGPAGEKASHVPSMTEAESKAAERLAQAEAARSRAAQFMAERRFADAKAALEEADDLEAEPAAWKTSPKRALTAMRSGLHKLTGSSSEATKEDENLGPVDKSLAIVSLYSKIAAAAGLLPGGLLNFAAILAVQITMVWRIAKVFGHNEGKDRIRGSILSLIGAAIPTSIGHGTAFAVAAIPALIAGTVIYFVFTPVLAYAMTLAVGKAFIMNFESGGTLLTFDPKAFQQYFLKEFQSAGGTVKTV